MAKKNEPSPTWTGRLTGPKATKLNQETGIPKAKLMWIGLWLYEQAGSEMRKRGLEACHAAYGKHRTSSVS